MKILLIIVTVVLAATAACSGYFIYDLNTQVDGLETELALRLAELGEKMDAAARELNGAIQENREEFTASLQDVNDTIDDYVTAADIRLQGIEADITGNAAEITGLEGRTAAAEGAIEDSLLQSAGLYEDTKRAVVRISDGFNYSGSGFILAAGPADEPGALRKIITAYHVIEGLPDIYVTLYDGRTWRALVWASSSISDVAVLKLTSPLSAGLPDMDELPGLKLADSLEIATGDPVFVVGSPGSDTDVLGLRDSITTGVISHQRRGIVIGAKYLTNLLQIDSAVNFGNSGGPLLNKDGEVIGIVIARIDPSYGDGISFAVTSNQVKKVVDIIIPGVGGEFNYKYPWVGVSTLDLFPSDIVDDNNAVYNGVTVMSVAGPAADAGVETGDIIVAVDGQQLEDSSALSSWVQEMYSPGDDVVLEIVRDGRTLNITVTLGEKPE